MSNVHPAPGISIGYQSDGEGPSVVLVHGITESRQAWAPLIPLFLEAGYRVTQIDLRGHGVSSAVGPYDLRTMADDLGLVLAEIGADDALLIGHSLGGVVVTVYDAAGSPNRGVINVDQPLMLSGFQDTVRELEPMLRGDQPAFDSAINAVFDVMYGALDEAERQRVNDLRDAKQEVVLGVWEVLLSRSKDHLDSVVDSMADTITASYLALHGNDPGADYIEWLTSKVPTATVEVWADHGHYPHLVDPKRFIDRVIEFDQGLL